MSLEQKFRYLTTWSNGADRRDLGAAKTKDGGEVTVAAVKDRLGGGEFEVVHRGLKSTDNVTLEHDYDRIRPNLPWMEDVIETAQATLTGQLMRGNVPVENTEVITAVPVRIGKPKVDANGDGVTLIEIEYMVGVPA